ncbi:MAG: helix-turn-helix transcriptional regulator [Anaerolineaceae bacterium]
MIIFRKRLQHLFKPVPAENRVYGFDDATVRTVQALAQKEGRTFEQMLSDLLSAAIGWRLSVEETRQLWQRLTPREQQVAALLSQGYTNRQIAEKLVISPETAKTHVRNAVHKFGLRDRSQLYQTLAGWEFEGFE